MGRRARGVGESFARSDGRAGLARRAHRARADRYLDPVAAALSAGDRGQADRRPRQRDGGRITLGVGIGGEYPDEFRACQIPIDERGPRTDEAIGLLRSLWTGERVTHDGRFYAMADVRIHPAPARIGGPPVVVAGRKPPAMRRAALLGDGWMPYLYSPRRYAESVETIQAAAHEAGRDLAGFEWFSYVFVNVNPDGGRARDQAARFLGGTYQTGDFQTMLERVAAVGTTDEVLATLQAFVDAGARHFIFVPASREESADVVDRLFGEVLARLSVRVT